MERGYTYVMVDLRGFGGSSGCLDWGGPGEQSDVKAAVEWAASQPWSTGHVGMYGKSYDGVTGLMGVALKPAGLDAVVSQEPVYDMYRYLYSNRVRFRNSFLTPGALHRDRRHAGLDPGRPRLQRQRRRQHRAPGLLRGELPRPAERRPRLGLLEVARPDRQGARARRSRSS